MAGLQGCRRAEAGVVAVRRTEAQRMAVWDDCAEGTRGRLCRTAVQAEKPRGRLCRIAVQTERRRGRDWVAACRLTMSEQDFSD